MNGHTATEVLPRQIMIGARRSASQGRRLTSHPDKAISQRATILAALADGRSRITGLARCRDVTSNLAALRTLGVAVRSEQADGVPALVVDGTDGRALGRSGLAIDVGNSATSSRLLMAVLAGSRASAVVSGNGLLSRRPMGAVVEPLRQLGGDISYLDGPGRLPVQVRGRSLSGGSVEVRVHSAQPVSALLFASTLATSPVQVSRAVVARDHTERLLRWTGIDVAESPGTVTGTPGRPQAFDLRVPGDPSGAAFLAALHLASSDGDEELRLEDVCLNPRRLGFFEILSDLGADVQVEPSRTTDSPEEEGAVLVRRGGPWRGVSIGSARLVQSSIDELPLIAALATQAVGDTVIADAAELRDKDTDRIARTVDLLRAFGASAEATEDGLMVSQSTLVPPARVVLSADHRIVFAALVLAVLAGPGTVLRGVDAAATSFPGALDKLSEFVEWETCS